MQPVINYTDALKNAVNKMRTAQRESLTWGDIQRLHPHVYQFMRRVIHQDKAKWGLWWKGLGWCQYHFGRTAWDCPIPPHDSTEFGVSLRIYWLRGWLDAYEGVPIPTTVPTDSTEGILER